MYRRGMKFARFKSGRPGAIALDAAVAVRSAGGLMGRLISSATDALLAGGALNIAVQSVAREVEQSVAFAAAA